MIVKILGIIDILAAILIFALSFKLNMPRTIMLIFIVILLAKGSFVLTKSVAAGFDLLAAIILILSFYFSIPQAIFLFAGLLILQKGFLSLA